MIDGAARWSCARKPRATSRPSLSEAGRADPSVLDRCLLALRSGGRLVLNAVTLETKSLVLERRTSLGGELIQIAVAYAGPLGSKTGWRPAMPVMQWVWVKP